MAWISIFFALSLRIGYKEVGLHLKSTEFMILAPRIYSHFHSEKLLLTQQGVKMCLRGGVVCDHVTENLWQERHRT
jgi:hypothetical protein